MNPSAILETSLGCIEIELWPEQAPKHVENFKKLIAQNFYSAMVFHRVIPGFMIQTGCPNGTGTGGPGWRVDAEFNKTPFTRGVVGMARSAHPNSAGSQFFICVADAGHLNGSYTAFGKVTSGMEFCDSIAAQPRDRRDRPLEDVKLAAIKLKNAGGPEKKALTAPAAEAAPAAAPEAAVTRETKKPAARKPAAKKSASGKPAAKKAAGRKAAAKPAKKVVRKPVKKPAKKATKKAGKKR